MKRPMAAVVVGVCLILGGLPGLGAGSVWAQSRKNAAKAPANEAFELHLRAELDRLRAVFARPHLPPELGTDVDRLFDLSIAHCLPATDGNLVRDIGQLRRAVRQAAELEPELAAATRPLMTANPELARAVVYAIGPDDNIAGAYTVLRTLAEAFPDRIADKPAAAGAGRGKAVPGLHSLVAAFCIVHDGPLGRRGVTEAERLKALFGYFSGQMAAGKLSFGPGTAPEVLALVIGPQAGPEELEWAFKNYRGNRMVGKLFGTIVYDTGAFKYGREKKVMGQPGGYTLQNIKKVGGVCAEQAYFASNVGKAIGVPAVIVSARGSDVAHAWVGYLKEIGGGRHAWDFDEGRHEEYRDLRGNVQDPQSGKVVPDGFIGVTAGLVDTRTDREGAAALFDAADRLAAIDLTKARYPPAMAEGTPRPTTAARPLGLKTRLDCIEAGLMACPAARRGWDMVGRIAAEGLLTPESLDEWTRRAFELVGEEHPDFAFLMLVPLIRAIPDTAAQDAVWEWLHGRFNPHKHLAAAVRFQQGQMWEGAGQPGKAWDMYTEVIRRYANQGQMIVEALRLSERLLGRQNKPEGVLPLYADAWPRITKPKMMGNEFAAGSTYVSVGRRYAALLDEAGKTDEAKTVRKAVEVVAGKA